MIDKQKVLQLIWGKIKTAKNNLKNVRDINSYAAGWEDGCIFEMQSLHDEIEEINEEKK